MDPGSDAESVGCAPSGSVVVASGCDESGLAGSVGCVPSGSVVVASGCDESGLAGSVGCVPSGSVVVASGCDESEITAPVSLVDPWPALVVSASSSFVEVEPSVPGELDCPGRSGVTPLTDSGPDAEPVGCVASGSAVVVSGCGEPGSAMSVSLVDPWPSLVVCVSSSLVEVDPSVPGEPDCPGRSGNDTLTLTLTLAEGCSPGSIGSEPPEIVALADDPAFDVPPLPSEPDAPV